MATPAEPPLVGGHIALDFLNTADEHQPLVADTLQRPEDLRAWGRRYGLLSGASRPAGGDADELERAIAARELLYTLLLAQSSGETPGPAELGELAQLTAEAYAAAALEPTAEGSVRWHWPADELASVRHAAVAGAVELLRSAPGGRLKQCSGEHCCWLFLDTSKRGNRRWCSMSECGQEAKDEQRRARRRARGSD